MQFSKRSLRVIISSDRFLGVVATMSHQSVRLWLNQGVEDSDVKLFSLQIGCSMFSYVYMNKQRETPRKLGQ